jgi:predicted NBD/HSP70 family sugar kinase
MTMPEGQRMLSKVRPKIAPELDESFVPAVLAQRIFLEAVRESGKGVPLRIAAVRTANSVSVHETTVFPAGHEHFIENLWFAESLVKTLLWQKGAQVVVVGGAAKIGDYLRTVFAKGGPHSFDVDTMTTVYEQPFELRGAAPDDLPAACDASVALGGHLEGCRIGFDLGASDRKVSAVIDGNPVFSEETVWNPRTQTDPSYHYGEIMTGLRRAAEHLPRVDAIGGSAAGIYVNNRVMVASLFRGIAGDVFARKVRDMFLRMKEEWRVPFTVVNDGEVTALAGAMSLNASCILGIAMGSSEAGGYANRDGKIADWLNELAFVPIDCQGNAAADEWSGARGCGAQYLSQEAVVRLAPLAGITLPEGTTSAEKLLVVQELMKDGDVRAQRVFRTIGTYFGYAVAQYAEFYDIDHVLILGRVTSGEGGRMILKQASGVLHAEFPELAEAARIQLPDERSRRVGQATAAASLPVLEEEKSNEPDK